MESEVDLRKAAQFIISASAEEQKQLVALFREIVHLSYKFREIIFTILLLTLFRKVRTIQLISFFPVYFSAVYLKNTGSPSIFRTICSRETSKCIWVKWAKYNKNYFTCVIQRAHGHSVSCFFSCFDKKRSTFWLKHTASLRYFNWSFVLHQETENVQVDWSAVVDIIRNHKIKIFDEYLIEAHLLWFSLFLYCFDEESHLFGTQPPTQIQGTLH